MVILDTCIVLWLATEPQQLSKASTEAVRTSRKRGGPAISGVTLYEVAWLAGNKRIDLDSLESFLSAIDTNFIVLPVTASIARRAADLPEAYPSDPMDRMIAATALEMKTALITKDRAIRRSKAVEVIWWWNGITPIEARSRIPKQLFRPHPPRPPVPPVYASTGTTPHTSAHSPASGRAQCAPAR